MGCWDILPREPKPEEEIREIIEQLSKHPVYIKYFKVPDGDAKDFLTELAAPVDYLSLME